MHMPVMRICHPNSDLQWDEPLFKIFHHDEWGRSGERVLPTSMRYRMGGSSLISPFAPGIIFRLDGSGTINYPQPGKPQFSVLHMYVRTGGGLMLQMAQIHTYPESVCRYVQSLSFQAFLVKNLSPLPGHNGREFDMVCALC